MAFQCVVVTPEEQALEETASQVILPAWDGEIGILTSRAPLLVKLGVGVLRVDLASGPSRKFVIDGGIAQMKDDRLTILTNQALAPEDIDPATARAQYAEAEARIPTDTKTREERTHQMRLARAQQDLAGARQA
jgi:F-type H+-transporting ATPase subunit epsilon